MNDYNIINSDYFGKKLSLGILNGKISQVSHDCKLLDNAKETINGEGLTLLPGMIDTHTHIRGGNFSYREDFKSGSIAGAHGGVTCYFEMPGGKLPCTTKEAFLKRKEEMHDMSITDFRMYAGAGYDNISEIEVLANIGAIGFKTFMNPPLKNREQEFYGLCSPDEESLINVMREVKKTGLTLTIHCEDYNTIISDTKKLIQNGENNILAYFKSHSELSEIIAVKTAIRCAEKTGCKINIAHVSTAQSAKLIASARKNGIDVWGETTLHYLFFDMHQMKGFGSYARMKPPFRERTTVDELLDIVKNTDYFYLGSDHAPFTAEEKHFGKNIWKSADGLAGIEMSMPLLLELVYREKLTLIQAQKLWTSACKRFGLTKKGEIKYGFDADLTLWELGTNGYHIKKEDLYTKANHNGVIYENVKLHNRLKAVFSMGKRLF